MSDIVKFWKGTPEEYDNIQEKNPNCIYFVIGNQPNNLYLGNDLFNKEVDNYVIEIESTNGNVFVNNKIDTDLIAYVYKNGIDITSEINKNSFNWKRKSNIIYTEDDIIWNENHKNQSNIISITNVDVENKKTVFNCEVVLSDGEVHTSEK
ncbi:MAG: hypothetical protein RSE41_05105 [Clostridia bacterium]